MSDEIKDPQLRRALMAAQCLINAYQAQCPHKFVGEISVAKVQALINEALRLIKKSS